jgi:hypothetical protein
MDDRCLWFLCVHGVASYSRSLIVSFSSRFHLIWWQVAHHDHCNCNLIPTTKLEEGVWCMMHHLGLCGFDNWVNLSCYIPLFRSTSHVSCPSHQLWRPQTIVQKLVLIWDTLSCMTYISVTTITASSTKQNECLISTKLRLMALRSN